MLVNRKLCYGIFGRVFLRFWCYCGGLCFD